MLLFFGLRALIHRETERKEQSGQLKKDDLKMIQKYTCMVCAILSRSERISARSFVPSA